MTDEEQEMKENIRGWGVELIAFSLSKCEMALTEIRMPEEIGYKGKYVLALANCCHKQP